MRSLTKTFNSIVLFNLKYIFVLLFVELILLGLVVLSLLYEIFIYLLFELFVFFSILTFLFVGSLWRTIKINEDGISIIGNIIILFTDIQKIEVGKVLIILYLKNFKKYRMIVPQSVRILLFNRNGFVKIIKNYVPNKLEIK